MAGQDGTRAERGPPGQGSEDAQQEAVRGSTGRAGAQRPDEALQPEREEVRDMVAGEGGPAVADWLRPCSHGYRTTLREFHERPGYVVLIATGCPFCDGKPAWLPVKDDGR